MVAKVLESGKKHRIAVAWAHDKNTISALSEAVRSGFASALMVGNKERIFSICRETGIDSSVFTIVDADDEDMATGLAVKLVREGEADVIMKGLISTDKYLKAIMDKEKGLMAPGAILSYTGTIEVPAYHKLFVVTDCAVIPYPNLRQKMAMTRYAIDMARKLGIEKPRIALIGASEKPSSHFSYSADYLEMLKMNEEGYFGDCIMDGPMDIFLACDRNSSQIKGVTTRINGDADILIFPSLESCNPFYKGLMLFADGKIAGLIRGTTKPVILMSRNETEKSKYYCIALSCLMV